MPPPRFEHSSIACCIARVEFETPSALAPNLLAENVACLLGVVRAPTLCTHEGSFSTDFCAKAAGYAGRIFKRQNMRTRIIGWIA
jgi:hypothetical protein